MSQCLPMSVVHIVQDLEYRKYGENSQFKLLRERESEYLAIGKVPGESVKIQMVPKKGVLSMKIGPMLPETTLPRVLLCYVHRPVSPAPQIKSGFRMAGCDVRSAGPAAPIAWGRECHVDDYDPPYYELPDIEMQLDDLIEICEADNWIPDVVVMVDLYDTFYLVGEPPPGVKFAWIAIENWEGLQQQRFEMRRADAEYHCVNHNEEAIFENRQIVGIRVKSDDKPSPPENSKWFPFAVDIPTRPFLTLTRDKKICQFGVPYDPRPDIWNELRDRLDNAPPVPREKWEEMLGAVASESTIFGFARRHREAAAILGVSETTLCFANGNYIPNRVPDAFATGAVLIMDDNEVMRKAFGAPWPENDLGLWATHERTTDSIVETLGKLLAERSIIESIRLRAFANCMAQHTYMHRAHMVLSDLEICPAYRLV